ncbi:MAG: uroporphyrinogen decarboxylase family protein [Verrucomicrobiota bacterium]
MTNWLQTTDADLAWFEDVYRRYRLLHTDPANCTPMIIINAPVEQIPTWEQRLADPLVMLRAELDQIRPHVELHDDKVPSVRVQFGTAQVAAAFGCELTVPPNSLPAAATHVLQQAEDVGNLAMPSLDAGWYGKLAEWTRLWQELLPPGVEIQHPDIQSAFNTAHLIRGNDILTDFYDCPQLVDELLDKVTDFMIALTRHLKVMISADREWFLDWGSMWRGGARISNCSMHMISPEFYREHVLARDRRFFAEVGGGRMHYCGSYSEVIGEFFKVPMIYGLDFDISHHDFFELCEAAPERVVLCAGDGIESKLVSRLLAGDWPRKRNIIVHVGVKSMAEGRAVLGKLRAMVDCADE